MTSPYSTRSRKLTPIGFLPTHLAKSPSMSPKSQNRTGISNANASDNKMSTADKQAYSTPQISRVKRDTTTTILSHHESLVMDPNSSFNNESSGARPKCQNPSLEIDRLSQNISSQGNELTSNIASQEPERQALKKQEDDFINEKKSYRTQFSRRTVGVPYRKCHSTMEEKVIGIINKINSEKECQKEIETLLERTRKISVKEMMNRYFVSGLHVILRLVQRNEVKHLFDQNLVINIQECLAELRKKIQGELDSFRAYEVQNEAPKVFEIPREKLIIRAFKILRKKQRQQAREKVQEKAIATANWFIENKFNDMQLLFGELINC